MSFFLGMLATLLLVLAGFCEVEGVRLYRGERQWALIEQSGDLSALAPWADTTHRGL